MIQTSLYIELAKETKQKLNALADIEFGHIPIVAETEWASPDWSIIKYQGNEILSFCNIVLRDIEIDKESYRVGGLNNVITPKSFRGKGYSNEVLRAYKNLIFQTLNCELGLLFCADQLIPFYEKISWYKIDSQVFIDQSSGKKQWKSNVMLLPKSEKVFPAKIELNGLPW